MSHNPRGSGERKAKAAARAGPVPGLSGGFGAESRPTWRPSEHCSSKSPILLLKHPEIGEMDLKPVIVYEKGLRIADARVVPGGKGG